MKKFVLACFFLFGLGAAPAMAQEPKDSEPKTPVTGYLNLNMGVYDKYLLSTAGFVAADNPVTQNSLTVGAQGKHWGAGVAVWNSKGLGSRPGPFSDETDAAITVTYSRKSYFVKASYQYFFLSSVAVRDVHTIQVYAEKQFQIGKRNILSPFVGNNWYIVPEGGSRSGTFPYLGITYRLELGRQVALVNTAKFNRDLNGAFGFKPNTTTLYYEASLPISLPRNWSVAPKVGFGGSVGDPRRPIRSFIGLTVNWRLNFFLGR